MAEETNKPLTELEKPAGAPQEKKGEPVIHVIPEEFHGVALKKKVVKEPPKPEAPSAAPVPQPPPPGALPAPPAKKKPSKMPLVVVILVLLVGGGAAAYFLLFRAGPPEPVCGDGICEAPAESPVDCPDDCGPPPPVCGDGECASSESPFICPDDCGPPPPVCGDNVCEGEEKPENCPVDCGPPPPVCGDNKCEGDETYESCPGDCEPPEPVAADDTDSDGLTDDEERRIYGSNPTEPNSDNDSFVDLNEVLNLFDPAQAEPGQLLDNPGITLYRNVNFGFDIYRPSSWRVSEDEELQQVSFAAPDGETILIRAESKPVNQALLDWYLEQSPGVNRSQVEVLTTRQGYARVVSPDRMTNYISDGDKVLVMSYDLGGELTIRYRVTFAMMANSLQIMAAESPAE